MMGESNAERIGGKSQNQLKGQAMAHKLDTKANGKAAMMYIKKEGKPWHGLGEALDKPATAQEAIEAAGLDWEVEAVPVYLMDSNQDGFHRIPNQFSITRMDRGESLGIVSGRYQTIQNRDCFKFFDGIVGQGKAIYHTAGSLRGGERVWLLAKLPTEAFVTPDDQIDNYVLLCNSHDGKQALKVMYTPIRVVCDNTLTAAMTRSGMQARVLHNGNIKGQFKTAAELLGLVHKDVEETVVVYKKMAAKNLTVSDVTGYFESVIPDNPNAKRTTRTENVRSQLLELFENGTGNNLPGVKGTVWAAYNAVTEHIDHYSKSTKTQEQRIDSNWFGSGAKLREKAFEEAIALI